jgi:NAD(P)-dependent dehydrogenase (short-subunit alcohol dehydrogenase family)
MIKQKVAVVTGAARGIGHGIVLQLAKDGYAIAIFDILEPKKVEKNIKELKEEGQPIFYFQGDLAQSKDRSNFCKRVMKEYGRIDILVNNAGVAPRIRMDILETTEESFDFVMNINLKGTFFLTQAVANIMIRQVKENSDFEPKIVNISSLSSYVSSPSRGEYCISKAGISMITKLFADRLSEYSINVYEIRPGIIYTDMTKVVEDKYNKLIGEGLTPIKHWGYPEDVAKAVSVCCSGKLDFSTGEIINVDGGFHLRRL